MEIKTVKELTEKGLIDKVVVYQNWDKTSAWIGLFFKDGKPNYAVITTSKGKNKIYKSFSSLFNDLKYIGWEQCIICLD